MCDCIFSKQKRILQQEQSINIRQLNLNCKAHKNTKSVWITLLSSILSDS